MTFFSSYDFFDRSALIRVFEAERAGGLLPILILEKSVSCGEILPVPIEFPLDAKKNGVIFGVTLFLTELDRWFWGTSGMRSVSIEGKVRC